MPAPLSSRAIGLTGSDGNLVELAERTKLSFLIRGLAPDLSTLADAVGLMALGAYIAFRRAISQAGRLRA